LIWVLWGGFDKVFRRAGHAGSFHFLLTLFFDAFDDSEDTPQLRFNVGSVVQWFEVAAGEPGIFVELVDLCTKLQIAESPAT
jgi:hypothetical protein